ncbi:MAG: pantoate--beta-alanine ligase [Flavobacteriales bacterium]|jgi:pantoate--beta-alanine ligase|nr:pantoate--beta-alanine ligase [Flavobacteriales bacterium]
MIIFKEKKKLADYIASKINSHTIGLTATMGALHEGHISLIKESKKKCDISICSIFINPKQFNNLNDFIKYPKTTESDLKLLEESKCDIVYMPKSEDLYEKNEKTIKYEFNNLEKYLEGKYRPNHFNGVAMIIEKLFKLIRPTHAFFGEKDLQQLLIIKQLVKKNGIDIRIVGCPTIRDKKGLAMSSRNKLLSRNDQTYSAKIYQQLLKCKKNYTKTSLRDLKKNAINNLSKSKKIEVEYLDFVDITTLKPKIIFEKNTKYAVCIAVNISGVRLIDNIIL